MVFRDDVGVAGSAFGANFVADSLASGAVWIGLEAAYPVESWKALLFHVTVGAVVYLGSLLAFCLRASDRDILRALVLKVKPLRNRP